MTRPPRSARRRWLLVALAVVLAVALELAIRAGEPPTVGPSGVDTLQVPLRDPNPDEFVDRVDHPWLPLERGTTWSFGDGDGDVDVVVAVRPDPYELAGVATTVVVAEGVERYLAQDVDGNVWLLGESGHDPGSGTPDWSIADGSPAGLVLPARPRRGDGWATVVPSGDVRGATRVAELTTGEDVAEDDERLVLVLTTEPVATGSGAPREVQVRLARGRGPVEVVAPGRGTLSRDD